MCREVVLGLPKKRTCLRHGLMIGFEQKKPAEFGQSEPPVPGFGRCRSALADRKTHEKFQGHKGDLKYKSKDTRILGKLHVGDLASNRGQKDALKPGQPAGGDPVMLLGLESPWCGLSYKRPAECHTRLGGLISAMLPDHRSLRSNG